MKKGPSAFPGMICVGHTSSSSGEAPIYEHPHGMSLRDYFAGQALCALSKDFREATGISANIRNIAKLNAQLAYLAADAMLEERGNQ